MSKLVHLIPLLMGAGFLILSAKIPVSPERRRPVVGIGFISCGLCFWVSSALLLVLGREYYLSVNVLMVVMPFAGLALFIPAPAGSMRIDQHRLPANILIILGAILGAAHGCALEFSTEWPARLLAFYAHLGLHATPSPHA